MIAPEGAPEEIQREISQNSTRVGAFGGRLHWLETTRSTNDIALRLAQCGAVHGTVVIADAQTAGRGRVGRTWFSPPGAGLYMSIVLRPEADPQALLTLASGVAVADGVRASTGLVCTLKWPNDLLVGKRKIAGILAEGTSEGSRLLHIVLGIGLNLRAAAYPADLRDRVTSIESELGRPADRARVIVEVLAALNQRFTDLRERNFDVILSAWRERAAGFRGALVEWDPPGGTRRGRVQDIDDTGALVVHDGVRFERLVAGEVRWVG